MHVSACEITDSCTPLVRLPANEDWLILQSLDQGAHGVVVPHIANKQAAEELVSSVKYSPQGKRGFTPFSKAGGFNNFDTSSYVKLANKSTLSVIIIESEEGLNNLDEILEVPDIDIVYFGAYDLSQALGYPGDVKHPNVISAITNGVDMVRNSEKYAGGFVPQSKDDIKWLLDIGMRFITYEVDSSMLFRHVYDVVQWIDKEIL